MKKLEMSLELSDNVHPNLNGSSWGWIQIKGTKIRVATYSGNDEKERCKQVVNYFNKQFESPGINIINQDDILKLRNYFGEHDKTQFEHWAFKYLDDLYNALTNYTPPE